MSSAEESALHYRLITPEQLAAQGGSLSPEQHQELQHFIVQQSSPQPQDDQGAQPSHQDTLLRSLVARLDSLQEQNQQLQAQLQTASSLSASSASPSVTIDWNEGLKFFKQASDTSSHSSKSKIKVKEPETFDGSRSLTTGKGDVNTFIAQITNYVADTSGWDDDRHRVRVCTSYMRGQAFLWVSSYLQLPEDTLTKDEYAWLSNFELFKKKLLVTFGDPDKAAADSRRLNLLRQTGAASLYAAEFRRLALSLNWGDEALKYHFVNGLKEELKDELARLDPIDSLDTLIERVVILDNRAFMRRLQRNNRSYTPTLSSVPTTRSFSSPSPATAPVVAPEDRMQIDANRRPVKRGPLSQAEKDYRRRNNLCSFCGAAGHFADGCPVLAARDRKPRPALRTAATTATFQISPAPTEDDVATIAEESGNDQRPTSEEQ
ncbi:hypothetical protein JCM1840_003368 [Sporobolomyces johnsonii]